jgi:hypothetical protein
MTSILLCLAHAPMDLVELAILTGRTVDQVSRELWSPLHDKGLVASPSSSVDEANVWSITDAGRETLRLIAAFESGRRRDAACQGVRS